MRRILLALSAVAAFQAVDVRPSEARPWYPWCAYYADQRGITECAFATFTQCLATISGIGGGCIQNWREPPAPPRRGRPHRHRHD